MAQMPGQVCGTGSVVLSLDEEALVELGVTSKLHRLRILGRLKDLAASLAAAGPGTI
jgi:hypothetical protein